MDGSKSASRSAWRLALRTYLLAIGLTAWLGPLFVLSGRGRRRVELAPLPASGSPTSSRQPSSALNSASETALAANDGDEAQLFDSRDLLRWGQRAALTGDRSAAYRIFGLAIESDPANHEAWLWRAGTAPTPDERIRCLERVLALNPDNARALRGLTAEHERIGHAVAPRKPASATPERAQRRSKRRSARSSLCRPLGVLVAAALVWLPFQGALSITTPADVPSLMGAPEASDRLIRVELAAAPRPAWIAPVDSGLIASPALAAAGVPGDVGFLDQRDTAQSADTASRAAKSLEAAERQTIGAVEQGPGSATPPAARSARTEQPPVAQASASANRGEQAAAGRQAAEPSGTAESSDVVLLDQQIVASQAPRAGQPSPSTQPKPADEARIAAGALPANPWVVAHRITGLWSSPREGAELFRVLEPGAQFQIVRPQDGPRLFVWDPTTKNYAYINASDVGPGSAPAIQPAPQAVVSQPPISQQFKSFWVAVHHDTGLWSGSGDGAQLFGIARQDRPFEVALPQNGSRLYVWDPTTENYAYVNASDVGPATRPVVKPTPEPVAPAKTVIWSGTARVSMYTCVELGGCNRTASGIWPYEGVVAVDRRVIPLGSTVWLDGLGTFLAADTGSAIFGNRIDVFVTDYRHAIQWGVRYLNAAAYAGR